MSAHTRKSLQKLLRSKLALAGLCVVLLTVLISLFGPLLAPYDGMAIDPTVLRKAPSAAHWLGTDELGRDVLSRILSGARITCLVGVAAVLISMTCGVTLGLLAGYFGGKLDTVISGFCDALWSFPSIILALAITTAIGTGLSSVLLAIGIVYTPGFARVIRGMTIATKEMEYVQGARAVGLNDVEIMLRHILPNVFPSIIVQASLYAAQAIITEATLSFLGLGIQAPLVSWGAMLKSGYAFLGVAPWLCLAPGLAILVMVLGLNFLGDGLRDALDVKIRAD